MIFFELYSDDKSMQFCFPENAKEITCAQMIQFQQTVESKKPKSLIDFEELETDDERNAFFEEHDKRELDRSWLSYYLREIKFFVQPEMSPVHLSSLPIQDTGKEGEMSVFALRNYIKHCVSKFDDRELQEFKLNGQVFKVPESPANIMHPTLKDHLRNITVGEYAVASELYNAFNKQIKGSVEGLVYMIAVLCRKPGELFPVFPEEQNQFIQQRAKMFQQLDLDTALNVGFFLAGHKIRFKNVFHALRAIQDQVKHQRNTGTT